MLHRTGKPILPTIEIDYELNPRPRDLGASPGGALLKRTLRSSHDAIAEVLNSISDLAWTSSLSRGEPAAATEPYWFNLWFPPLDGLSLAAILKSKNPKLYLEIGSGNSTKFARRAVKEHNLQTRIVSIDPSPRAEIDAICDEVIRIPLENTEISVFNKLQSGDVLLIDSSHRSFMNSDVTVFFTEILPGLPPGVIYGIHDIFLPDDYPKTWTDRYYNEQYLLTMYLLGGADGDRVLFPVSYIARSGSFTEQLATLGKKIGLDPTEVRGGCFWMQRGTKVSDEGDRLIPRTNWLSRIFSPAKK
jgi:hypothetical protein